MKGFSNFAAMLAIAVKMEVEKYFLGYKIEV
jgi:hypothetical protein